MRREKTSRKHPRKDQDIKIKTEKTEKTEKIQLTDQEEKTLGILLMMMRIKIEEELREEEELEIEFTSQCLVKMISTILTQDIITNVVEMILKWTDLHKWETDNAEEEAWDPHLQSIMIIIEVLHKDTTTIPTIKKDIIRIMIAECLKWEVYQWDHHQEMDNMAVWDKVQEVQAQEIQENKEIQEIKETQEIKENKEIQEEIQEI
jgi:hypothetical protein